MPGGREPPADVAARHAFLRVQLVNEGGQPVYFDSLTLRHPRPALYISQENHYYPFGLALGGAAANTVPAEAVSKAQYNGGSVLEDELLAVELGLGDKNAITWAEASVSPTIASWTLFGGMGASGGFTETWVDLLHR